ncbi:MAG: hypothetical protein GXP28_00110 [Planctomycetes bacterium]|nr:hypothetical protein [Planctomycetota bacterium]
MNSREKILAMGVGALAVLWAGTMGVDAFRDARDKNDRTLANVKKTLDRAREANERGRQAQSEIRKMARLSLPTDLDMAKSSYEDWLREQLIDSGLYVSELDDKSSGGGNQRFQEISFQINAQGSLAQLSGFLYHFYRAGHLHRISEANLSPNRDSEDLDISLTIDALSLDDCKRNDSLTERPSELVLPPLEEVRQAIVGRNIFAVYRPAILEDPNGSEPLANEIESLLAKARFTGTTHGQDGWQMAVRIEGSGDLFFFREGDPIEIGRFEGQITKLDGRRVIVTLKNGQVLIRLGQYLSQAQPLADQAG